MHYGTHMISPVCYVRRDPCDLMFFYAATYERDLDLEALAHDGTNEFKHDSFKIGPCCDHILETLNTL